MSDTPAASWTFLTNHAHVLICIAQDPESRLRDIAERVGITERSTQSIVADLVDGGYLTRRRVGRRNHYEVIADRPLRHPIERDHQIGQLLELVGLDASR
ncbi:helix-turn-helix transcriptional regulator [Rhabdothermincola salaria]|uniref:helix-turn-helix transcriptional regulator n=1 Tax=Rhabdothermincola salaria TaxID=2903142 RepID=UPI001E4BAE9D|nr:MarR family transcriptional regulator [Rhabdothermincola salaria]MCD9624157.1 winged helix-turn-helix transcriptional regulator [Rhabdothermincola salaria]